MVFFASCSWFLHKMLPNFLVYLSFHDSLYNICMIFNIIFIPININNYMYLLIYDYEHIFSWYFDRIRVILCWLMWKSVNRVRKSSSKLFDVFLLLLSCLIFYKRCQQCQPPFLLSPDLIFSVGLSDIVVLPDKIRLLNDMMNRNRLLNSSYFKQPALCYPVVREFTKILNGMHLRYLSESTDWRKTLFEAKFNLNAYFFN